MKFLVVFAVLSVCAINSNAFFLKGHKLFGGKSGSSSGASSESYAAPPPPPPPPAEPAAPAGNPLAGLGQLLAIPLNIKKSLLASHQKKINQRFDKIIGLLGSIGGGIGGGHGGGNGGAVPVDFGPEPIAPAPIAPAPAPIDFGGPAGGLSGNTNYNAGGSESFGGSASTSYSGGGSYNSGSSYSGGGSYSNGGNVQTYQPQPAPNTAYHSQPIVLHLYPVDSLSNSQVSVQSNSVDYAPAPIAPAPIAPAPIAPAPIAPAPIAPAPQHDCNHAAPLPIAPQPIYQPAPQPIPQPEQTYGPPDYEPAQPISSSSGSSSSSSSFDFEPQVVQEIQPSNTYLPPYRRY